MRLVAERLRWPRRAHDGICSRSTDIHLAFRGCTAIDGVSFHVDDGELFAIIGPNGAGKTSIFNSSTRCTARSTATSAGRGERS